jgi:hypothetical protein
MMPSGRATFKVGKREDREKLRLWSVDLRHQPTVFGVPVISMLWTIFPTTAAPPHTGSGRGPQAVFMAATPVGGCAPPPVKDARGGQQTCRFSPPEQPGLRGAAASARNVSRGFVLRPAPLTSARAALDKARPGE